MLAYLPATYLARLFDVPRCSGGGRTGPSCCGVAAVGRAGGGGGSAGGTRLDPLLIALGAVFGLLVVDMLIGAPLQLNTVFGYSPTVGGRFAGMGNLAYGQFAGAAFLLFGLVSRRLAGWRFATAAALRCLVLAIIIDGMPMWGSDVGGVLAFVPAVGVTPALLSDRGIRCGRLLWGSLGVLAVAAVRARGPEPARRPAAPTWDGSSSRSTTRGGARSSRWSRASSTPTSP